MTLLNLPAKFTALRPHQEKAISEIIALFEAGKKVVFLDAPTGSGKTVIGEYIRQHFAWSGIYTCTTKSLQDQFARDFDYARILKGRSNYPTEIFPEVAADECRDQVNPNTCNFCPNSCAYQVAKTRAANSPIPVLNLDYLLNVCRLERSDFRDRDLCIIDECDELENKLLGYVGFTLTDNQLRTMNINRPNVKTYSASQAFPDWREWANDTYLRIIKYRDTISRDTEMKKWVRYNRLAAKVLNLAHSFTEDSTGKLHTDWIYCYDTKKENSPVTFKPIHVKNDAKRLLFDTQRRFLLMSATIIAPSVMAEDFGLEREEWGSVQVESTFPAINRPVHPINCGSMAWKYREKTLPNVIQGAKNILDNHPNDRIIIHTHTGRIAQELYTELRRHTPYRSINTYRDGNDRERALADYKREPASVLIAMSMSRGIDLPGDLCKVQVICVLPRMPIQDQQISARLYSKGGQEWYNVFTIRELVQATGRGVRSSTDEAITYILDSQFLQFHRRNQRFFPKYWNEAVDFSGQMSRKLLG